MANFTDNTQALSTFKPYISQEPIIAEMSLVGREKQAKYDEGIQKIQGQIDTVAGMDVVRDVDKAYLQQALNQLGGNLRKVAAGDFSNYQLVNSVGGMISQIGKDTNIQNAVGSTARYRKGVAAMETAIKEGKSSPSNEYAFNKQASQWLQDGNVKSSFNGGYKPYTNWKKEGLELLKAMTGDKTITDDAFVTDPKTGKTTISDTTIRRSFAGISPEKIQQALITGLTPAAFEQMQMDGVYSYANADANSFTKHVATGRDAAVQHYANQRKELEDSKSTTTSVKEKANIDKKIADLNKTMASVAKDYNDIAESAYTNLDGAKAQYFTKNALDGFSKAFSFTETSQTYVGDTPGEVERQRQENIQKYSQWKADYDQRALYHAEDIASKRIDQALKAQEIAAKGGNGGGSTAAPIPKEDVPFYNTDKVIQQTESIAETALVDKKTFMDSNKDANGKVRDNEWYKEQEKTFLERPSQLSPKSYNYFLKASDDKRKIQSNLNAVGNIVKEADRQFGSIESYIPKGNVPLKYTNNKTGVEYTYTPEDFVNINTEIRKRAISGDSPDIGASGKTYDLEAAKEDLRNGDISQKAYHLLELQTKREFAPLNKADKHLLKAMDYYNETVNNPYEDILTAKNKYIEDELNKRITNSQGNKFEIPSTKEEDRGHIAATLVKYADNAIDMNGGVSGSNATPASLKKIAIDPKAIYTMEVREGTARDPQTEMYILRASGAGEEVEIRLTPEQKRQEFGRDWEAPKDILGIRKYQDQIRLMGGTTNTLGSETSHDTAYLNKNEFTSVNLYGINGDLTYVGTDGDGNPRYTLNINVYDPIEKVWHDNIPILGQSTIGQGAISSAFSQISDADIHSIITETEQMTAQDIKALQEAVKKPF